jgi:hypothetical protein
MKTIIDDPEGFFDQGGWNFLNPESGDDKGVSLGRRLARKARKGMGYPRG